jgi:ubiquinone biosynthesis protein
MGKRILENAETFSDSFITLPGRMEELMDKLVEGEIRGEIHLLEFKELLRRFDRSANRISFSVCWVALSIILLRMIIGKAFGEETFLTKTPIIEIG